MKHLLIDVGNSRIKAATFEEGELVLIADNLPLDAPGIPAVKDAETLWVSNVRQHQLTSSLPLFSDFPGRKVEVSWQHFGSLMKTVYQPDQLGVDRYLGLLAVLAHKPKGQAALVVDAGTAMTIDLLDGLGVHQGGVIVAGRDMMLQCFANRTGLQVKPTQEAEKLSRTTSAALKTGAELALHGALLKMMAQYPDAGLFLGGGASKVLGEGLNRPFEHMPQMVLSGLAELARQEKF